ncbi:MAG: YHYH protein, partial [Verrucomicrobiota bacterium]
QVDFFKDEGRDGLDHVRKNIYARIQQERRDLKDPDTNPNLGRAAWREYSLDFKTPFAEVDTLRLSAGFGKGAGTGSFLIDQFRLTRIEPPARYDPNTLKAVAVDAAIRVHLGGRWYFDPRGDDIEVPERFDHRNADRLLYRSDVFSAPFAGNMTAWLKKGYLDLKGREVTRDRFLENNVTIEVTETHLVVRSKNLPNHPTAVFPDRWRALDGNPNHIQEQEAVWMIPLVPREHRERVAMTPNNDNRALPGGAIGLAVNGVIFFNPFDHIREADAVWRLDRCCGHPSPRNQYHYHKYPVCVKSPWEDDGGGHSPVIGFAFDGYPVYGPYEAKGVLAKEAGTNPLNAFNVHRDEERGWHYHVTPGKFPHIIGGYWGVPESKNRRGRGRRPPPRRRF